MNRWGPWRKEAVWKKTLRNDGPLQDRLRNPTETKAADSGRHIGRPKGSLVSIGAVATIAEVSRKMKLRNGKKNGTINGIVHLPTPMSRAWCLKSKCTSAEVHSRQHGCGIRRRAEVPSLGEISTKIQAMGFF